MISEKEKKSASRRQKVLLVFLLIALLIFGIAAEQPAESDCCQPGSCEITLYPPRIEGLNFGESAYVTVGIACEEKRTRQAWRTPSECRLVN